MHRIRNHSIQPHSTPWRKHLFDIIFEAETPTGKLFDILLLAAIFISVFVVIIESVTAVRIHYHDLLQTIEWAFTILFTIEYLIRLLCVQRKRSYIFSFFGIVDFLAVIPTYLGLFLVEAHSLLVIRALRLLRVFRVLKLGRYMGEFEVLLRAIRASRDKILVFLMIILTLTVIMGTAMYLIEGESNGFTSIPKSIYWAIVTMTTVGYGDLAPQTVPGQFLASIMMILGYAIIVVPTGIFSVELSMAAQSTKEERQCTKCNAIGHEIDATFCRICGATLNPKN